MLNFGSVNTSGGGNNLWVLNGPAPEQIATNSLYVTGIKNQLSAISGFYQWFADSNNPFGLDSFEGATFENASEFYANGMFSLSGQWYNVNTANRKTSQASTNCLTQISGHSIECINNTGTNDTLYIFNDREFRIVDYLTSLQQFGVTNSGQIKTNQVGPKQTGVAHTNDIPIYNTSGVLLGYIQVHS